MAAGTMAFRTYLDHAATTPMLPEARAAMAAAVDLWANPSSPHREGRAVKAMLEDARRRIASCLGWSGEVVLTSGASEAAALALASAALQARAVSAVEHDVIRRAAPDALVLPVDASGVVRVDAMPPSAVVAIQSANSETGVIQPLDELAVQVRDAGGVLLADCSQSAGKLPLPDADMVIVSAHKLGGPPGAGALLVRDLGLLTPGRGGQERGYRGGTENVPAITGFAAALEARGTRDHLPALRARLDAEARALGAVVVAGASPRLAEIGSYRLPGVSAVAQLIALDGAGVAVSAGSACSSGSMRPSPVLTAMGWGAEAAEVIRVSFGLATTDGDVDRFLAAWAPLARRSAGQKS